MLIVEHEGTDTIVLRIMLKNLPLVWPVVVVS